MVFYGASLQQQQQQQQQQQTKMNNMDMVKVGRSVLQADISMHLLKNLLAIVSPQYAINLSAQIMADLEYPKLAKHHIYLSGGVIVPSSEDEEDDTSEYVENLIKKEKTTLPLTCYTFQKYEDMDILSNQVNYMLRNNRFMPILFDFNRNPWSNSASAILFSYLRLNVPWMYYHKPESMQVYYHSPTKIGQQTPHRQGFRIKAAKCGVGILDGGILLIRLKVGHIGGTRGYLKSDYVKPDVWNNNPNLKSSWCHIKNEEMYLHIFTRVGLENDAQINNTLFLKDYDGQLFDPGNHYMADKQRLLAPPLDHPMTLQNVKDLYQEVYDEHWLTWSLDSALPHKQINFSMPNVNMRSHDVISIDNASAHTLIQDDYFKSDAFTAISGEGNFIDEVHMDSKLTIDEKGVCNTTPLPREGAEDVPNAFSSYDVDINQPFCFAVTKGKAVLMKGMYI